MKHYITAESFGAEIPENWEEIAEQLNAIIDERGIADDLEAVNDLWDEYWSNGGINMKSWYIVDDCTSRKGEVFTRKVDGSRDEAIAAARAEWEHLSRHDQQARDAYYVGYAAEDADGCVDFDTMTDIEDIERQEQLEEADESLWEGYDPDNNHVRFVMDHLGHVWVCRQDGRELWNDEYYTEDGLYGLKLAILNEGYRL